MLASAVKALCRDPSFCTSSRAVSAALLALALMAGCGHSEDSSTAPSPEVGVVTAAATVDFDESYVVMGLDSVVVGHHSRLHSGNIGVDRARDEYPPLGAPCIVGADYSGCYAGQYGQALQLYAYVDGREGTKIVGDTVRLQHHSQVSEVHYLGELQQGQQVSAATIQQVTSAYFPLFPNKPNSKQALPSDDATGGAGADITVPKNAELCLEPGTHPAVTVRKGATLRFAADCDDPSGTAAATYEVGDIVLEQSADLFFGPGDYTIRDLHVGDHATVTHSPGTTTVRNLTTGHHALLSFAPGTYHYRNYRTGAHTTAVFQAPQIVDMLVLNKLQLDHHNEFNASGPDGTGVDASLIRIYVNGSDGPDPLDDPPGTDPGDWFPPQPRAVFVDSHTKLHANIMALKPGGMNGGTIHLGHHSIAIGSYFGRHIIVDSHVELTNRNGLVGAGGGEPPYPDGDADNDGIPDEIDNCMTISNVSQADQDLDDVGDACDNCPATPNPRQELAYPDDELDSTGAACAGVPIPYCGDGNLDPANDEECDDGFANHGDSALCSLYCTQNAPVITAQPQGQDLVVGDTLSLSVAALGHDLSYQWYDQDGALPGAQSATFEIASVVVADAGSYYVVVHNLGGTATSATAVVSVDGCDPATYVPVPTTCGIGACEASGQTACVAGVVVDQCAAGSPAADDATCDGIDDDCDGYDDEDYVAHATSCGVGACAATGTSSCVAGNEHSSCIAGAPAPSDATCDGIDDDCSGTADEDYLSLSTNCGVGACAASGTTSCASGAVVDSCAPGAPAADDATCDGIDDDCSGLADEDYAPLSTNCGVGACVAAGVTSCVGGSVQDSCAPGNPAPADTTCNGVDDDCNGDVDDGFQSSVTHCGVGACAADGATSCVGGTIINSCTPSAPAATDPTCDGIDDDCDGAVDDDYVSLVTSCGVGACAMSGETSCAAGAVTDSCAPAAPAAGDPTCNAIDDDCDGTADEDYVPVSTSCGVGACGTTGQTTCQAGAVVDSCAPGTPDTDDTTCDGVDDDCDGIADEDYLLLTTNCGIGACASSGSTSCVAGAVLDSCNPGTPAPADTSCNALDDDCDGTADEDYAPVATSCGVGACGATGQTSCQAGAVVDSCAPGTPAAEDASCDGIDDDCNGLADEDYAPVTTACGVGACSAAGSTSCVDGAVTDSCMPGSPASSDASCNDIDDDCDGTKDEDYVPSATSCGVGACAAAGQLLCATGVLVNNCSPGTPAPSDTSCNALDDDCDGATDEDYAPSATSCGVGSCMAQGQLTCVAGNEVDSCVSGGPSGNDATCDGIDDDCDGQVDESFVSQATSCGIGACAATGASTCVDGNPGSGCTPSAAASNDASCDGIDDDCDGQVDEDYAPGATNCGVGACGRTGSTSCVAGAVVDSCSPGTPAGSDASCDGIDDDCDGAKDEDYAPVATSCGVGACGATGASSCVAGSVQDSCSPGSPATDDASCDGVDDDCDGDKDEDYAPVATSCGIGACGAVGATSCIDGSVTDDCSPGTPAANDASCNGVDDDCDGTDDEDYAPLVTSCGVGACGATGATSCQAGAVIDSCTAGIPAAADTTCDGIDDDCNGIADDGYQPLTTACGVGACAASGVTSCVTGTVQDSCAPGPAAPADTSCNGIDDDCDGTKDEDYAAVATSCGVGACAETGITQCVGGSISNTCSPGTPAADDATCDGIDDDCDGSVDDDYVPILTDCGVGACTATGSTSCEDGAIADSCAPGAPSASDASCNGIDDDCDGTYDEDYAPVATSCGVGACTSDGVTSCVSGAVADSCAPGTPAGSDPTCDGIDDDCDGNVDDDYVPVATDCGVGACAAAGFLVCTNGALQDTCQAGTPAIDDASCNGVDEDCDGTLDEDYTVAPTACGTGACAALGSTSCQAGDILNLCQPGSPAASDATCDGIDDDCNGTEDEDYVPTCSGTAVIGCAGGSTTSTECDNADQCDGDEQCVAGNCQPGTPPTVDDGNECTADACDAALGVSHVLLARGTACSGGGVCDLSGQCVVESVPVITQPPADATVSVGSDALFSVTATGGNLDYEWRLYDSPIEGAGAASYARPQVSLGDSGGVYTVRVWNGAGEATSAAATLTVVDDVAPEIEISVAAAYETSSDDTTITGFVRDTGVGVAGVEVQSDRYGGQAFAATLDADGSFSALVPLEVGDNTLTVVAYDDAGNAGSAEVVVTSTVEALPRLSITSPLLGAVVHSEPIDIAGLVRTSLPAGDLRLVLGSDVVYPAGGNGEYAFTFQGVHLQQGANSITVVLQTPYGNFSQVVLVSLEAEPEPVEPVPPEITLHARGDVVYVTGENVPVAGTVTAQRCVNSVTVGGLGAQIVGEGTSVSFSADLPFPAGQSEIAIDVVAIDCDGLSATAGYTARHDLVDPVLTLSGVVLAPAINPADVTPYRLSGTVTEANLAGLSVDAQSIGVVPAGGDDWTFELDVALSHGQTRSLTVAAWDEAGNRVEQEVLLQLDSQIDVDIISPIDGSEFVSQAGGSALDVVVRVPGAAADDHVFAIIDGGAQVELALAGTTATGSLDAGSPGDHQLTVRVEAADSSVLGSASSRFSIVDSDAIVLRMNQSWPGNGDSGHEGNSPIVMRINRPVEDPTLFGIEVRETVHGEVYQQSAAEADIGTLRKPTMVEIHREREIVMGLLKLLPGGVELLFEQERSFAYGSTVDITLSYDGEDIGRFSYRIRPTPTLVRGFVTDVGRDPLQGVVVSIPAIRRSTRTDEEGAYNFGFGEPTTGELRPGRYRTVFNPGNRDPRLGTVERLVHVQAQRLTEVPSVLLPVLSREVPHVHVGSGDTDVQFDGGKLQLDLSEAELLFENGLGEGDLHVQATLPVHSPYNTALEGLLAQWFYSTQPAPIEVRGTISLSIAMPSSENSYAYLEGVGDYAVLLGLDPRTLLITPVGVGRVDRVAKRVISEGDTQYRRLDVIAYALVPPEQTASLERYATGEITLDTMVGELRQAIAEEQE